MEEEAEKVEEEKTLYFLVGKFDVEFISSKTIHTGLLHVERGSHYVG